MVSACILSWEMRYSICIIDSSLPVFTGFTILTGLIAELAQ
jgi:hypothetical protein